MSQDVRNHQIALKSLPEDIPTQPWSMDSVADRLMDEVFSDVDRMVETGGEPLVEPAEPEYVSLHQIKIPQVVLPLEMRQPTQSAEVSVVDQEKSSKSGNSLAKLLLVAACASLGITLLLWLASQGRLNRLFGVNPPSTPVVENGASSDDMQFMDYMQRSLDRIDQQSETEKAVSQTIAQGPPRAALPVPLPGNLPPEPPSNSSVLERVYIPVYPRNQSIYPAPPTARPYPQSAFLPPNQPVAPNPVPRLGVPTPQPKTTAAKPATTKPASQLTPTTPKPTTVASPTTPSTKPTTVASRPASPTAKPTTVASRPASPTAKPTTVASRPTTPPPRPTATVSRPTPTTSNPVAATLPALNQRSRQQPSTQAAASQPAIRHVLRGILKSDDSSKDAALFEVNGATRRVYVGETISSSGWTLVEVNNDAAVIRRNGEVRSIYPSQDF